MWTATARWNSLSNGTPTNSQDVSIKGYTGRCLIDCCKLDGTLLWRLDMGPNIRAGAHYTQFMVYDFDGDGRAEMAVSRTRRRHPDDPLCAGRHGCLWQRYITIAPQRPGSRVIPHSDNYVCSAEDYRLHLADVLCRLAGSSRGPVRRWPDTLEACFGIPQRYDYR